jgi:hypothetical protein
VTGGVIIKNDKWIRCENAAILDVFNPMTLFLPLKPGV